MVAAGVELGGQRLALLDRVQSVQECSLPQTVDSVTQRNGYRERIRDSTPRRLHRVDRCVPFERVHDGRSTDLICSVLVGRADAAAREPESDNYDPPAATRSCHRESDPATAATNRTPAIPTVPIRLPSRRERTRPVWTANSAVTVSSSNCSRNVLVTNRRRYRGGPRTRAFAVSSSSVSRTRTSRTSSPARARSVSTFERGSRRSIRLRP